ncbi:biotin/lipoyl-containing protein [[Eubacterium] cellulosolvens]
MPGRVMSLRVREGDSVRVGQPLLMLEAMKMENEITASVAGTVRKVWVTEGTTVKKDQGLLEIS